jgi:hypothetical protein
MLALQRQIGNRATVSSLSRPVLQRIEEAEGTEHEGEQNIAEHEGEGEEAEGTEHGEVAEHEGGQGVTEHEGEQTQHAGEEAEGGESGELIEAGVEQVVGGFDFASSQITTWSALPGTSAGNMALSVGSGLGVVTGIHGAYSSGKTSSEGKKIRDREKKAGRGKEATARAGKRDWKTGGFDSVQSGASAAGGALGATGAALQAASTTLTTAGNVLGGIGGCIALPFAALDTLRTSRKAAKQYSRFRKLRKDVEDPKASAAKASKAFEAQEQALSALRDAKKDASEELAEAVKKQSRAKGAKENRKYDGLVAARKNLVAEIERAIAMAEVELEEARAAKEQAERAMEEYTERASKGEESPSDIKAYAMRKNQSGFVKKVINFVGGVAGVGGGTAATVAAFAIAAAGTTCAAATFATPIGWALCGAAAVVGIAMAGYAFWKWASKRYESLVKEGGAERGFKTWTKAINPFYKKIPDSHRKHMAERLYELAAREPVDQEALDARNVIADLGLKWYTLKMKNHKKSSTQLIYDKMAS